MENLQALFLEQLKDIHNAEKQLTKALPKMAKAATDPALRAAFEEHLTVTEEQVARLEAIFQALGVKAGRKKCVAMEGLVLEGKELIDEQPEPAVLDAGLIAAAQRVEHYEIAAYGTARRFATLLGHNAAARQLEQTLREEEQADRLLTELADGDINRKALAPNSGGSAEAAPKPKKKASK
jgi:ferritin-like metal-binding protein YciE